MVLLVFCCVFLSPVLNRYRILQNIYSTQPSDPTIRIIACVTMQRTRDGAVRDSILKVQPDVVNYLTVVDACVRGASGITETLAVEQNHVDFFGK